MRGGGGGGIILIILFQSIYLITVGIDAASRLSDADADGEKQMYIVYMSAQPPEAVNLESYYLKFLSSVLPSEEAAKDALVYTYTIITGFSAQLTPDQVSRLQQQPGVMYVMKEIKYTLDGNV